MNEDTIYSAPLKHIGSFEFDDAVVDVFPDMIRRSVPGYASMLSMIGQCAERYIRPDTNAYDLGCSLGAGTLLMRDNAPVNSQIIGVDSSESMVTKVRKTMARPASSSAAVEIRHDDIRNVTVENASLVVLNLTLQFIAPHERDAVITTAVAGLHKGGALILSEKICFDDPDEQDLMTTLHHDFKRAHGYSDLEISQKRTAIENRLVPETLDTHIHRLRHAGFRNVTTWFQCFNFASILAVK